MLMEIYYFETFLRIILMGNPVSRGSPFQIGSVISQPGFSRSPCRTSAGVRLRGGVFQWGQISGVPHCFPCSSAFLLSMTCEGTARYRYAALAVDGRRAPATYIFPAMTGRRVLNLRVIQTISPAS